MLTQLHSISLALYHLLLAGNNSLHIPSFFQVPTSGIKTFTDSHCSGENRRTIRFPLNVYYGQSNNLGCTKIDSTWKFHRGLVMINTPNWWKRIVIENGRPFSQWNNFLDNSFVFFRELYPHLLFPSPIISSVRVNAKPLSSISLKFVLLL